MGECADFTCPACGLTGHVSGGSDCGMNATTTTIYCETCAQLQDVVTCLDLFTGNERQFEPRCAKRKSHPIRLWNRDEPCPRCGRALLEMDASGNFSLWD